MKAIRNLFVYFFVAISFVLGFISAFIVFLLYRGKKRELLLREIASLWAKSLVFLSGIKFEKEGLENIPCNEPLIFASNHQGAVDIVVLLAVLPPSFCFIVKKELFSIPFFGWYLKNAGYLPVDRGGKRGALEMFMKAQEKVKNNESIAIFPEGTRSKDGSLLPFKKGSLLLAFKTKAKVVPIAISGSNNVLPKGSILINSNSLVRVKIGPPLTPSTYGDDYDKATEDLHETIKKMLSELRKDF